MSKEIKVLIVDDSAIVRQTISSILSKEKDIKVIGTAQDPIFALEKMKNEMPDVIILDIEMPRMDGLTFLYKIMTQQPIPVIICSTLTQEGSDSALKAISYGAVDIITKPKIGTKQFLEESGILLVDSVRAASIARLKTIPKIGMLHDVSMVANADAVIKNKKKILTETTDKVIVVGASTGGTEALKDFLCALPVDVPGIVVVQHMPENFTRAFANRLDSMCQIHVKEAKNGDSVLRGQALIAPGNLHTLLKRSGAIYSVEVKDGPLVSRHRPSVNVLFQSTAYNAGKNAVGVIMTGMGNDGATGMKEMKDAGAYNLAQDEESCVVFGMPKEAIKAGAVDKVVPLTRLSFEAYQAAK
ncbi:MAG: chemotaxis response regulator protein-glutamate methylesterase [Spirochaetota bacterium]